MKSPAAQLKIVDDLVVLQNPHLNGSIGTGAQIQNGGADVKQLGVKHEDNVFLNQVSAAVAKKWLNSPSLVPERKARGVKGVQLGIGNDDGIKINALVRKLWNVLFFGHGFTGLIPKFKRTTLDCKSQITQ
jgi:hypothetical protein